MRKFFLSSLLVALLLPIAGAHAFLDVPSDHENKTAIYYLDKTNVIDGHNDKTFKAENGLNRAEVAKMIVTGLGFDPDADIYKNCFPDVTTQWFARFVCFAKEQGWIDGFPDGTYGPEKPVLDVEMAKIMLNAYGFPITEDLDSEEWFADFIHTALVLGLIDPDDFVPGTPLNRGQAAEEIYRSVISKDQGFDRFDFEDEKAWLIEDLINSIGDVGDAQLQEVIRRKIASLQEIKSERAFFEALEDLHRELEPYYLQNDFDFFDEFNGNEDDFAAVREFVLADLEEEISLLDDEAASWEILGLFEELQGIQTEAEFFDMVGVIEFMIDQYYHNSGEPYWIDDEGPLWMEDEFEGDPWWMDYEEWEPLEEDHGEFWNFDDHGGNPWEDYDDPWHDEFFEFEGSDWDHPFGHNEQSIHEGDFDFGGNDYPDGEDYPDDDYYDDYPDELPENFDDLSPEEQDAILREIYGEDSFGGDDHPGPGFGGGFSSDGFFDDFLPSHDEDEMFDDFPEEDELPENFDDLSPEEQDAILREIYGEDSFEEFDEDDFFDTFDEYDGSSYTGY